MADQHQARVENMRSNTRHGRPTWSLTECTSENWRCRDRPTLVRIGDVLTSGYTRRTIHHGGTDGDQGAGQRCRSVFRTLRENVNII